MSVILNFDSTAVKPLGDMEAIPAGWYPAMITATESKETNNKDGHYLNVEFTVLDGDYKDRKVFTNLNLGNKNPTAVEIAYRALSSICHATGVIQVGDSAQLHNIPFMLKVGVRPATTAAESADGKAHDASNDIKGYKSMAEYNAKAAAPAGAPAAGFTPPPAPATPAAFTPPAAPAAFTPPAFVAPAPAAPAAPAPAPAPAVFTPPPATGAPATPPWLQKPAA
jgi:hypothetical protein